MRLREEEWVEIDRLIARWHCIAPPAAYFRGSQLERSEYNRSRDEEYAALIERMRAVAPNDLSVADYDRHQLVRRTA
jgi:hypothetical protein